MQYMIRKHWLVAVGALLLAGCASTPDPGFERPTTTELSDYFQDLGSSEGAIEVDWWRRFNDPQLTNLIELAIANNPDLRVLAESADVAREFIGESRSSLLPTVATGFSTQTLNVAESPTFDYTKLNLGSEMSWELDYLGKVRAGVAAQEADYQSALADWRAGQLAIASDVAVAYFQLRLLDEQLARQKNAIERTEEILLIYRQMLGAGLESERSVREFESLLARQKSALAELEGSRDKAENGLATLTGQVAGRLVLQDTVELADIQPVEVPGGLTSEILNSRPDILAAEYALLRACNLETQARLAKMPSIGLTSVTGTSALRADDLFRTLTGGLSSFFRFGALDPAVRARARISEAQVDIAEAEYLRTVYRALEEVANALTDIETRQAQDRELRDQLQASRRLDAITRQQLELGTVSRLDLLQNQTLLLEAEQQYLFNRWQTLIDTVTLFKAVGGGWPPEYVGA